MGGSEGGSARISEYARTTAPVVVVTMYMLVSYGVLIILIIALDIPGVDHSFI